MKQMLSLVLIWQKICCSLSFKVMRVELKHLVRTLIYTEGPRLTRFLGLGKNRVT